MSDQVNLLVVEDEPTSLALLAGYLENLGYKVFKASSVSDARDVIRKERIALALLDLELPDGNGLDLAEQIRQTSKLPVVFVTQSAEETDRLKALELGGDDYITKPFNPKELALRLRNILNRISGSLQDAPDEIFMLGTYTVDIGRHTVRNDSGLSIELTRSEFAILNALTRAKGRALSREQILNEISPDTKFDVFDRTVDVLISRLRKKLEKNPKDPKLIITVQGHGYRLDLQ